MGPRLRTLLVLVLIAAPTAALRADPPPAPPDPSAPKGAIKVERYPPSWRMKVAEAIERGAKALNGQQAEDGSWGATKGVDVLGHSSLPLLTLLKAANDESTDALERALKHVDRLPIETVYGAGCYLMALHARYHPKADGLDTDVGTARAPRMAPEAIRARLTPAHLQRIQEGVAFLVDAQTVDGLWYYGAQQDGGRAYDLSNAQYALLGLRAAADCGVDVPEAVWRSSIKGLLVNQEDKGPKVDLVGMDVKDGYAYQVREPANARGFRYKNDWKHGPLGENTVPVIATTGSMTVSGLAGLAIAREGLWRTRRFTGKDRKQVDDAMRDGLAWMQENFTVAGNPNAEKHNHLYYLYGLERMGMLVERRWIGTHDWYKEGADLLLEAQRKDGSWGDHVQTSFAVLFLKRATSPPAIAVSGG